MRYYVALTVIALVSPLMAAEPKPAAEESSGVVEVKLGTTIERTWEQVKAANYVYGPKQDYDKKTNETHIYLPYGSDQKLYSEVKNFRFQDAAVGKVAKVVSKSNTNPSLLTYKLHFDKPIGTFRYKAGWTEVGPAEDTAVGVEYSTDGKEWKTIREVKGSEEPGVKAHRLFVSDFKAEGLNSDTLYIRYYTRNVKDPLASGKGFWIHFWNSGDPKWGDASRTFFELQLQVWVTPAPSQPASTEPAGSAK